MIVLSLALALALTLALTAGVAVVLLLRSRTRALAREQAARRDLVSSEQRLGALVQHATDVLAIVDRAGRFTFVSPSVERLFGIAAADLIGANALDGVAVDGAHELERLRTGLPPYACAEREVVIRRSTGEVRRMVVTVTNRIEDPAVQGFVVNAHDVTDRRAFEELLSHQATHDDLTGLPNRSRLPDVFHDALRATSQGGKPVAVLFVDLDHFKQVNDDLGHEAGDEVLRLVARRLGAAVRDGDTALRVGGDEFVVVCPAADELVARQLADRLASIVRQPYALAGTTATIGASVGIAVARDQAQLDTVLREADRAMYRHKARPGARARRREPAA